MPTSSAVPDGSLLGGYVRSGAFADCYTMQVQGSVVLSDLIEAFFTTRLFKLERWLLAKALGLHSTDQQARQLAMGAADTFSAWRVESRTATEILLDAGHTRSWLCVAPQEGSPEITTLLFGSAVIPMRPGGKFGPAFHLLLGFHRLYSKLLLAATARRLIALRRTRRTDR